MLLRKHTVRLLSKCSEPVEGIPLRVTASQIYLNVRLVDSRSHFLRALLHKLENGLLLAAAHSIPDYKSLMSAGVRLGLRHGHLMHESGCDQLIKFQLPQNPLEERFFLLSGHAFQGADSPQGNLCGMLERTAVLHGLLD